MKTVRKWGNGYGISISKGEALELGVREGDEVDADIVPRRKATVDQLPSMRAGGRTDYGAILDEDAKERVRRARA